MIRNKINTIHYMKKAGRTFVLFNTGTRVHKPKKGRGSYQRIKSFKNGVEDKFEHFE